MPVSNTLYLLTDGGRARFVERSRETRDFVTISEIDGRGRLDTLRAELRSSAPGRSLQSGTPARHAIGREGAFRQAKEAFVEEMADRAAELCRKGQFQAVFIAAPGRLIAPLRRRLESQAQIAGVVEKDLTKSPDAALGQWLGHLAAV